MIKRTNILTKDNFDDWGFGKPTPTDNGTRHIDNYFLCDERLRELVELKDATAIRLCVSDKRPAGKNYHEFKFNGWYVHIKLPERINWPTRHAATYSQLDDWLHSVGVKDDGETVYYGWIEIVK